MPFIPHTQSDTQAMLRVLGVADVEELFDEIPVELRCLGLKGIPKALTEFEVARLMQARAEKDQVSLSFLGAGAYEHHIPAAVWEIATRGEYYSAYTPYQAEASQGTLQVIYEYQTMVASLTGLDVSNASLYDGASALAEAVLMAVRINRKSRSKRVLIPQTVHPFYADVVRGITGNQGIEIVPLPYDAKTGRISLSALDPYSDEDITAVVIPQTNVFGILEEVHAITDWAADHGVLAIALVNPIALGLLRPPGDWGTEGVAIACGEGQPLGIPVSSGGPYFGFLCCRKAFVRQLPGRLVGRTVDLEGTQGFTLTLQAREQHIRRSRATSNICTNQGLMVIAATIYMSLLGPEGLRRVAARCHSRTRDLVSIATGIDGVDEVFATERFHEAVLRLPVSVEPVLNVLSKRGILGGVPLAPWYPELGETLLVCATETKSDDDLRAYGQELQAAIRQTREAQ
ncbi:MAG: aminomethyl-transferring glycine dehydrogenase subunit GcvPA [Gammaproteobacteria bacterium]